MYGWDKGRTLEIGQSNLNSNRVSYNHSRVNHPGKGMNPSLLALAME